MRSTSRSITAAFSSRRTPHLPLPPARRLRREAVGPRAEAGGLPSGSGLVRVRRRRRLSPCGPRRSLARTLGRLGVAPSIETRLREAARLRLGGNRLLLLVEQ